jgi:hypothetical protein
MGHSMGGGASFLAAKSMNTITALVNMAAAETNPTAIGAGKNISQPALIFAGANDCVAPPVQHQKPMYDSLASSCKTYVEITGATHCQFANSNAFCTIGETSCFSSAGISATTQQAITIDLMIDFLDTYLKSDFSAEQSFRQKIAQAAGFNAQQSCLALNNAGVNANNQEMVLFPNPVKQVLNIKTNYLIDSLTVLSIDGKYKKNISVQNQVYQMETEGLKNGIYILCLKSKNKIEYHRFVKIN